MCGRFTLTKKLKEIIEFFQQSLGIEIIVELDDYIESYNIAPGQEILILYNNDGNVVLTKHRWGLIPSWAKEESIGYKMINARIETVEEKPSFKNSFYHGRCLVIADGYYEWLQKNKQKIPYYFYLKDLDLFTFAGIRASWENQGSIINSCSIITTTAGDRLEKIHNRMPVILKPENEANWLNLDLKTKNELFQILNNNQNKYLQYHRVSSKVNSPNNNSSENIVEEIFQEPTLF